MLNTYSQINFTRGWYAAGLYKVLIAPREWLVDQIVREFKTNIVTSLLALEIPRNFIELEFTEDTYEFTEKPKNSKNGVFFDVTVKGTVNNITPEIMIALETFRNHELVAILYDRKKRLKVVGDKENGLVLTFSNKENNNQGGLQMCDIDLSMNAELAAPFYQP